MDAVVFGYVRSHLLLRDKQCFLTTQHAVPAVYHDSWRAWKETFLPFHLLSRFPAQFMATIWSNGSGTGSVTAQNVWDAWRIWNVYLFIYLSTYLFICFFFFHFIMDGLCKDEKGIVKKDENRGIVWHCGKCWAQKAINKLFFCQKQCLLKTTGQNIIVNHEGNSLISVSLS